MKTTKRQAALCWILAVVMILFTSIPEDLFARGGSFGGSRGGSFGGSRGGSYSGSRGGSFGGSRGSTYGSSRGGNSFGSSRSSSSLSTSSRSMYRGNQLSSSESYTRSYGVPRRQETQSYAGNDGVSRNYQFNHYGGYADGLMTGYAMGRTSFWWYMPFHPAFYYSPAPYVVRTDGVVDYYPPTFSITKLFFTVLVGAVVIFIVVTVIRSRRANRGSGLNYSQSSFG